MLPGARAIRRERERRHAARLRVFFEEIACPVWPAWPADRDGHHHRWVREHWTTEACDRYDAFAMAVHDLGYARLVVLAQDLTDLGDDAAAIRVRIAADGHPVWDDDDPQDWRAWIADNWLADRAETLARELRGAKTSLGWKGDHRERAREHDLAEVERRDALARFDLSEEEMKPFLERRVCGIRGRYRLLGSVLEKRLGITEADIDAP